MKYTGTGMTTAMQLARLFEAGQTTLNHIKQNKYQKNETLYKYISTIIYLKGFSVFFLRKIIWGIPFQILTPTREKAFRLTLSRDSLVWNCSEVEAPKKATRGQGNFYRPLPQEMRP